MKRSIYVTAILSILAVVIQFGMVNAAEEGVRVYTLGEGIRTAFENNWSVKAKEEQVVESELSEKEAKASLLPTLSTSYSYTRMGEVYKSSGITIELPETTITIPGADQNALNNYSWTATISQPIFTGYALVSARELARLGIDASKISLELEKLDLALGVKEAYFNILKADKALEVAKSSVDSLEAHLSVAKNFYDVGMIPVNDMLKAEVELANAQHTYIKAQNDARLVRVSFNVLLSRSVDEPFELEDILVYTPESPDFEGSLEKALETRPEIRALNVSDSQIDQQIRLAKSKYYPEVGFSYNYTKEGDTPLVNGSDFHDSSTWNATLGLSWTIWNWDKTKSSVRQVESRKRQLAQTRKTLEDGIRLELKSAILSLNEAEEKIPTAQKAVDQAEENLRVSEERYKAQVTTSTEVLDAQTLLSQARMNYYSALYDHNLARATLLRAIGEY